MQVRDWMTAEVAVAAPQENVADVRKRLDAARIRQLPVVAGGTLIGIVTDRDVRSQHEPSVSVAAIMTPDPLTTSPTAPIEEAATLLARRKIGALPVVERGVLVGIISTSDCLQALVELTGVLEPMTVLELACEDGTRDMHRAAAVLERSGSQVVWTGLAGGGSDGQDRVTLRVRSPLGHVPEQVLEEAGFRVSACIVTNAQGRARSARST